MKFSKLKGKLPPVEGAEPPAMAMEVEMESPEEEMDEEMPGKAKAPAALASISDDELLAELERRKLLEDGMTGPEPEMEA